MSTATASSTSSVAASASATSTLSAVRPETPAAFDPERPHRLSRFLHLRPASGGGLVAESAATGRVLALSNATQVALVMRFLEPSRPAELVEGLDAARREALLGFFAHCHGAGLLAPVAEDGRGEDEVDDLAHWESHDLLFHARSRRGRTPYTVGATYHLSGDLSPEPALKATTHEAEIRNAATHEAENRSLLPLPRGGSGASTRTLTEVLEARRSRYSTRPVDLESLGEFLYRTSRITGVGRGDDGEMLLKRLYPSGGSLHSLELYVIPARCPELELGVYHYRPNEHGLAPVAPAGPDVHGLLEEARRGTGRLEDVPSVLLVLSARFRRVARKYQGLAYRLILKEVGAAFQTFYLVATDMGLAPCALGTGDSDCFARAAKTSYHRETSVGELILGGAP